MWIDVTMALALILGALWLVGFLWRRFWAIEDEDEEKLHFL